MSNLPKVMCIDVETTGLKWWEDQLHGVGVGYDEENIKYYPLYAIPDTVAVDLANVNIPKLGHNLHSFDAKFLERAGYPVRGDFHDTMIIANCLNPDQKLGLKYLSDKYFGVESLENKHGLDAYMKNIGVRHIGELCYRDIYDGGEPHLDIIAKYCEEDVRNTLRLFKLLMSHMDKLDKHLRKQFDFKKTPKDYYYEEAMPLEYVLFNMEYRGVKVDMTAVDRIKAEAKTNVTVLQGKLDKMFAKTIQKVELNLQTVEQGKVKTPEAKARKIAGAGTCKFQWTNNNHVANLLFKQLGLPLSLIQRTAKGRYKTDKEAMDVIIERLPDTSYPHKDAITRGLKLFAEFKLQQKIVSTYTGDDKRGIISHIKTFSGEPRIYPTYSQTTGTGRLKCKAPNMQNIKRNSEVKKFFIPDHADEVFDDADYSQIELRVAAHVSLDEVLVNAYRNGEDLHILAASNLFGRPITKKDDKERQAGKRTNFLTIYDGKARRLQAALRADTSIIFSVEECKAFIKAWFDMCPGYKAYLESQLRFFQEFKFCIAENGRIRHLPDIIFGQHVKWEKITTGTEEIQQPYFYGPQHQRDMLLDAILKKTKDLKAQDVSHEMIGWAAWRRYSHAVKVGYNMPIQGPGASQSKRAMIKLNAAGRIVSNQVHDSLTVPRKVWDIEAKKQTISIMETSYPLIVPVLVDVKTVSSFHPDDVVKE